MALRKIKLGELIEKSELKNSDELFDDSSVRGISINKCFAPTKADAENIDLKCFKIVKPNYFAFNTATSRNGEKISIAFNDSSETIIVSSLYDVFYLNDYGKQLLDERYLYIFFNRSEFDRYARTDSWGSAREYFRFGNMCDVEIELPDIETQRKFVAVYLAMIENQKSYERGLEDLKMVCDGFIENLRRTNPSVKIGRFINEYSEKNKDKRIDEVVGLSTSKSFREAQSRVNKSELGGYKIVHPLDFAYVPTTDTWKVLAFAVNHFGRDVVVSPIYEVFSVDRKVINPDYLAMWLKRKEFDRYARYNSWGSARENFIFDEMKEVEIPIPDLKIQESIVNIYQCFIERQEINEMLKKQIKDLCPILIKGSIEEVR